jgi:hypothetical protein
LSALGVVLATLTGLLLTAVLLAALTGLLLFMLARLRLTAAALLATLMFLILVLVHFEVSSSLRIVLRRPTLGTRVCSGAGKVCRDQSDSRLRDLQN